ncbi:uncharacterized protein LOC128547784 [Mercenaria mercenaria]|uniref:uncharacterized protein LOC128547784 n=1 Tax=Mercenaria mercenaria TaxID=6596 RepID=UPI00234FB306|nr:uncharacterized protein LOC128547784 [Mercenaria mercenaria]
MVVVVELMVIVVVEGDGEVNDSAGGECGVGGSVSGDGNDGESVSFCDDGGGEGDGVFQVVEVVLVVDGGCSVSAGGEGGSGSCGGGGGDGGGSVGSDEEWL